MTLVSLEWLLLWLLFIWELLLLLHRTCRHKHTLIIRLIKLICSTAYDLRFFFVIKKRNLAIHDILILSFYLSTDSLVLWIHSLWEHVCFISLWPSILRRCNNSSSDPSWCRQLVMLNVEDKIVIKAPEAATIRFLCLLLLDLQWWCYALTCINSSLRWLLFNFRHERWLWLWRRHLVGSLSWHLTTCL